MQISTTLHKRLCWQLRGTNLDKAEWSPGRQSRCHPPHEINEVNNALKSIKQFVSRVFLLTWTHLLKKEKTSTILSGDE